MKTWSRLLRIGIVACTAVGLSGCIVLPPRGYGHGYWHGHHGHHGHWKGYGHGHPHGHPGWRGR